MPIWGSVKSVNPTVSLPREVKPNMSFSTITTMTDYKIVNINDVRHEFKKENFMGVKKTHPFKALADQIVALPVGSAMRPTTLLHEKSVSSLRSLLAKMGYSLRFRAAENAQYFWAEKRPEGWRGTNNRYKHAPERERAIPRTSE